VIQRAAVLRHRWQNFAYRSPFQSGPWFFIHPGSTSRLGSETYQTNAETDTLFSLQSAGAGGIALSARFIGGNNRLSPQCWVLSLAFRPNLHQRWDW